MAVVYYREDTGAIYGVALAPVTHPIPQGVVYITVAEDYPVMPGGYGEPGAKVVDGALVATTEFLKVPTDVTKLQLVRSLRTAGLWGDVKSAIKTSGTDTKEDWELSHIIVRADPMVTGFAAAINITPAEMDELFRKAATL